MVKKDKKRSFSADQKLSAFMIQKGKCAHCKEQLDRDTYIAHHIKKHCDGGKTVTENCQLLCANCSAKHHRNEGKTPKTIKLPKVKKPKLKIKKVKKPKSAGSFTKNPLKIKSKNMDDMLKI